MPQSVAFTYQDRISQCSQSLSNADTYLLKRGRTEKTFNLKGCAINTKFLKLSTVADSCCSKA